MASGGGDSAVLPGIFGVSAEVESVSAEDGEVKDGTKLTIAVKLMFIAFLRCFICRYFMFIQSSLRKRLLFI